LFFDNLVVARVASCIFLNKAGSIAPVCGAIDYEFVLQGS